MPTGQSEIRVFYSPEIISVISSAIFGRVEKSERKVVIALGTNLGDRMSQLQKAILLFKEFSGNPVFTSPVFETPPIGPGNQSMYLNMVLVFSSSRPVGEIFAWCKEIENRLDRKKRGKWESREIDCDLLLAGKEIIETSELTIPHPRMTERDFVLKPLAQLAPETEIPGRNKTVGKIWQEYVNKHGDPGWKAMEKPE